MAQVSVTKVTPHQLAQHLRGLSFARAIVWLVLHHTWRPTAAQYRGRSTIWGVTRYHVRHNGWSDNGYHIMIGPDGSIWLCRPMRRSGGHCRARNHDSIGVSLVLNGDREAFFGTPQHDAAVAVLALLAARFGLNPRARLGGHTWWAAKTCPGTGLTETRKWNRLVREVWSYMSRITNVKPVRIVLADGSLVEGADARIEPDEYGHGRTRVNLREPLEAAGVGVEWVPGDPPAAVLHPPGGAGEPPGEGE